MSNECRIDLGLIAEDVARWQAGANVDTAGAVARWVTPLLAERDALRAADAKCRTCGRELDPGERSGDLPVAGDGLCSECFARWHDAPIHEGRVAALRAEVARLKAALVAIRDAEVYRMWQACPDCDYPDKCSARKACDTKSRAQEMAEAALAVKETT